MTLTRQVANVEESAFQMRPRSERGESLEPKDSGVLWYGRIFRRVVGDEPQEKAHSIPFAVEYRGGLARRVVADRDLDGSLSNEPPISLHQYPPIPDARSALFDVVWRQPSDKGGSDVSWTVRLVFEPQREERSGPVCRVQKVYGMVGEMALGSQSRAILLVDGDGNGRYSKRDFGDGIYLDVDGDRHFVLDRFGGCFVPLAAPARVGEYEFEVVDVREDGTAASLRETQRSASYDSLAEGAPAPDFEVTTANGRLLSLRRYRGRTLALYFAASWCPACSQQLPEYAALYDRYHARGFDVLLVSYDRKVDVGESFARQYHKSWDVYASGRLLWENPIGMRYRADHPGLCFLIGPDGRLIGKYEEPSEAAAELASRFGAAVTGR